MKTLKQFYPTAIPIILLTVGIISITLGSFVSFENKNWEKYLTTLGGSVLASGIFALILKSVQFLGVFKEELNSIIFETKFLKNRVDLPQFWEKVTKELVKDRFPHIHNNIMNDVKDTYLPTSAVQYYDNCVNVIDIKLVEKERKIISVRQKQYFTIIPSETNQKFSHPYWNRIICPVDCSFTSCTVNSIKVNGKEKKGTFDINQKKQDGSLITDFDVPLSGEKLGYNLEIDVTKVYSLDNDNLIAYSNRYIQNNFKVQIFLEGIKVKFHECGTLFNFKTNHNRPEFIEKVYTGIIYKRQGYIIYLELK